MSKTTVIDAAIARVRAYAKAQGWGANRYASEAGLSEATVRPMFGGDWNPTAETLRRLEGVIPRGWRGKREAA